MKILNNTGQVAISTNQMAMGATVRSNVEDNSAGSLALTAGAMEQMNHDGNAISNLLS